MNSFVIGDIHGSYKALGQCLQRSRFNAESDRLIVLGDVCDGYPEVRECVEFLRKLPHCDLIRGNHDQWALDWTLTGVASPDWTSQRGESTIHSYNGGPMPPEHAAFLKSGRLWLEVETKLFVHGGFNPNLPISVQNPQDLMWDRTLIYAAYQKHITGRNEPFGHYEEIYIGHTPTQKFGSSLPLHLCNVWAMDTGAGWSGPLTIMNIETKQYWQSEPSAQLYSV